MSGWNLIIFYGEIMGVLAVFLIGTCHSKITPGPARKVNVTK